MELLRYLTAAGYLENISDVLKSQTIDNISHSVDCLENYLTKGFDFWESKFLFAVSLLQRDRDLLWYEVCHTF